MTPLYRSLLTLCNDATECGHHDLAAIYRWSLVRLAGEEVMLAIRVAKIIDEGKAE